jgi:hypothetical protein
MGKYADRPNGRYVPKAAAQDRLHQGRTANPKRAEGCTMPIPADLKMKAIMQKLGAVCRRHSALSSFFLGFIFFSGFILSSSF